MNFKKLFLVSILCLFSSVSWSDTCVRGDCKNGLGTYLWDSGDKYVGEFSNGLPNGEGLITTADGDIYEGGFKNSKFHGNGEWSRVNGDVYVGEFYDNDPHGSGVYEVSDGRTIEGTFTKGKLTAGILISQDGSATDVITGEPVDRSSLANRNATDVVTAEPVDRSSATNSKVNESENRNSVIERQEYVLREECRFIEDLNDEELIQAVCTDGQGTFTWADGAKFVGEWQDDNRHGQGTLTWADGNKYVGEFKDGKRDGYGALKINSAAQGLLDVVLSDPKINNAFLMNMSSMSGMAKKEWIRAGEWKEDSAVGFANINITHALIAREYINTCAIYGFMGTRDAANLHQELSSGMKTAISRNLVTRDWLNKKNNDVKMAAKIQKSMIGASDIQDICSQYSGLLEHFIVIENEF